MLYAHGPTLQRLGGLLARLRYRQNLLVPTFFLDEYSGILFQSIFCMNIREFCSNLFLYEYSGIWFQCMETNSGICIQKQFRILKLQYRLETLRPLFLSLFSFLFSLIGATRGGNDSCPRWDDRYLQINQPRGVESCWTAKSGGWEPAEYQIVLRLRGWWSDCGVLRRGWKDEKSTGEHNCTGETECSLQ